MRDLTELVAEMREAAMNDPRGDAELGDWADRIESALAAETGRGEVVVDQETMAALERIWLTTQGDSETTWQDHAALTRLKRRCVASAPTADGEG